MKTIYVLQNTDSDPVMAFNDIENARYASKNSGVIDSVCRVTMIDDDPEGSAGIDLAAVYGWAVDAMECCDEPEWSLYSGIVDIISDYIKWNPSDGDK